MLPNYQYKHYYDQLCDCCEDAMVTLEERTEDDGECTNCDKVMCEDCRAGQQCGGCEATCCADCVASCDVCNDELFCEDCLEEHQQDCTRLTRAVRKVDKLKDLLNSKELEEARLRRRLVEINQEIEDISVQKANAERSLENLIRLGH